MRVDDTRYFSKVHMTSECWVWKGAHGRYGQIWDSEKKKVLAAHRVSYERIVGPIPQGMELDHLCRNTLCVRPEHLEPVTHRENMLRGKNWAADHAARTHCPQGHPYEGTNLYINAASGGRVCRACVAHHQRAYQNRKKARLY